MAERQGFEPWIGVAYTRFPGVRLQPLGHLSVTIESGTPIGPFEKVGSELGLI